MKINQGLNNHNAIAEAARYPFQKSTLEEETNNMPETNSSTPLGVLPGASDVELSREGLAASQGVDFFAEKDNLEKLTAFGKSGMPATAHAALSYESVKHLLD